MTAQRVGLAEIVDHLLGRGAVLRGRATISLTGIDLVHLELNLLLSSVDTLLKSSPQLSFALVEGFPEDARRHQVTSSQATTAPELHDLPKTSRPLTFHDYENGTRAQQQPMGLDDPSKTAAAANPDQSLAQLVLVIVELLRQVVELQALRRVEGGGLSDEQVERLGLALMRLDEQMAELKDIFGLTENDLDLTLGLLEGIA